MDPAINPDSHVLQYGLEALLVEVNGLANRLKATDPRVAIPAASRAALQVLRRNGPQTVPQIARSRFSSRQNIQILINRLKEEGLVEFVTNPEHKRSVLVRLTIHGQTAIAQATEEEAKLSTELLPSFSQIELSSATEVLNKLRKLLDGKDKPESHSPRSQKVAASHPSNATSQASADIQSVSASASADSSHEGEFPVSLL
jgi:DNA-binding MarR family transcriptional regulator